MAVKEKSKKVIYKSIKIREEDYLLVKQNKDKTGINIDFFLGQLIKAKLLKSQK